MKISRNALIRQRWAWNAEIAFDGLTNTTWASFKVLNESALNRAVDHAKITESWSCQSQVARERERDRVRAGCLAMQSMFKHWRAQCTPRVWFFISSFVLIMPCSQTRKILTESVKIENKYAPRKARRNHIITQLKLCVAYVPHLFEPHSHVIYYKSRPTKMTTKNKKKHKSRKEKKTKCIATK